MCVFLFFGLFWVRVGPFGLNFCFVNATLRRRIDPRSPEASANIFILRIKDFEGRAGPGQARAGPGQKK